MQEQQKNDKQHNKRERIPPFFLYRGIAWFSGGILVGVGGVAWELISSGSSIFIGLSILIMLSCVAAGAYLLWKAVRKEYFTLELECVDVVYRKRLESLKDTLNPMTSRSMTMSQLVTFRTMSGQMVTFVYDRHSRFLTGARYLFYFYNPADGSSPSMETLEQLKIGHSPMKLDLDGSTGEKKDGDQ